MGSIIILDNPYTYTGREYDAETGLYYYRARYYSSMLGRFINKDPIGIAGGFNQFTYVGSNPVNAVDPWGLFTKVIITEGTFFYNHAAVYIDNNDVGEPAIYDPAGSYGNRELIGFGDIIEGTNFVSLDDYVSFHTGQGDDVHLFVFNTTVAQEQAIYEKASTLGYASGGQCATRVAEAIEDIGPFTALVIEPNPSPSDLYDALMLINPNPVLIEP